MQCVHAVFSRVSFEVLKVGEMKEEKESEASESHPQRHTNEPTFREIVAGRKRGKEKKKEKNNGTK